MGSLTGYLQEQFEATCPTGWHCLPEVCLMDRDLSRMLGYSPRADVVLTERDSGCRLWVEFEVSRADPVANHAKFATAHLFQPQAPNDVFVSMVSRHVDRGRRNLAASTIQLMRQVGMRAVQTVLFPHLRSCSRITVALTPSSAGEWCSSNHRGTHGAPGSPRPVPRRSPSRSCQTRSP